MTINRILVPTDFGAASSAALDYARDLADATGATVYLLHVVDDIAARFAEFPYTQLGEVQTSTEESARAQLDDLARTGGFKTPPHTAVLTSTSPASAIVGYAVDEHVGPHRHGHARTRTRGADVPRCGRRSRRAHGAVSGADRSRTETGEPAPRRSRIRCAADRDVRSP